ncbi:hypothetical protein LEP1GSC150_4278 [Leptospira interrogans serovar Copenhageni str. LT2050]|uniref:7TM diverse intracellular signaling domain protein n=1 Tax=Leptospira interrogans serovar Copenhageni str. LT2050 TaxID=1001598 RepID=M3GEP4_LEPIT|nr:hypothetical protein LEP1GSC150_4278 [Leptospira interrogans serovar Copenhageni str. LT2050]
MISDIIKFDPKIFYDKLIWIFIFFVSTPIFAFPIDLTKDWKIISGKNLNASIKDVSWKELKSLPIPEDSISFSEGIYTLTLLKTFEVSANDFQKLALDGLSIHFPLLTNVYEVYFNGEKIGSGGIVLNGKIIKDGFKRHVILPIPENKVQIGKNEIRLILSSNAGEELNVYASFDSAPLVIDLQSKNVLILSERSRWMLAFLYLFVGFYHFLLYFKRPQEKYNLFFGLFSTFFLFISILEVTRSMNSI